MSANVSQWSIDGVSESMAVISHLDEVSGADEVVFRRNTVELENDIVVTESGNPSAAFALLERTAARYDTSARTLLHSISGVESAGSVLEQSLPAGAGPLGWYRFGYGM